VENYSKLRIGHLYVNAIRNKIPLLSNFISEHDFDILCLSETKVDPSILVMSIPGYTLYRKDRTNCGGGVAILIREEFTHHPVTFDANSGLTNTEVLSLKVQVRKFKSILITCLYRAKFNLSYSDNRKLEVLFSELESTGLTFYACGDYNIHLEQSTNPGVVRFNNMLHRHSLTELIQAPTRGRARLDLIITNDAGIDNIQSTVLSSFISDHESILIVKPLKVNSKPPVKVSFRDFKNVNWEEFGHSVISTFNEPPPVHDSVNDEIRSFISNHVCIFDRLAPIRQKNFRIPQISKIALDN
jgi:hypothetical protein